MRGSGTKGLPGRQVSRAVQPPEKSNTDLIDHGQGSYFYRTGTYTDGGALIAQNVEVGSDQHSYVIDAGYRIQLARIGCQYQFEDALVQWSHDSVRWYGLGRDPIYRNPMIYDPDADFGIVCDLLMPLPYARYFRMQTVDPDPPGTQCRFALYARPIRDPDMLVDVNEYNRDDAAGTQDVAHYGLTLDLGEVPDYLWVGSGVFDNDVCDRIYATDTSSMRRLCTNGDYYEKFHVTRTTRRSVTFSENLWGGDMISFQRGPFHPNFHFWSGLSFTVVSYYALAFKNRPGKGISCTQSAPFTDRTPHHLGTEPEFVFVSYNGGDGSMGGVYGLSKDEQTYLLDYGLLFGGTQTRAASGFDVDDRYVYHPRSSYPTYVLALNNSTTPGRKFGTYAGNGSATGPTISGLGFDPGLVVAVKIPSGATITDGGGYKGWTSDGTTYTRTFLQTGSYPGDFFSLGAGQFQITSDDASINEIGSNYWYGCFYLGDNT